MPSNFQSIWYAIIWYVITIHAWKTKKGYARKHGLGKCPLITSEKGIDSEKFLYMIWLPVNKPVCTPCRQALSLDLTAWFMKGLWPVFVTGVFPLEPYNSSIWGVNQAWAEIQTMTAVWLSLRDIVVTLYNGLMSWFLSQVLPTTTLHHLRHHGPLVTRAEAPVKQSLSPLVPSLICLLVRLRWGMYDVCLCISLTEFEVWSCNSLFILPVM